MTNEERRDDHAGLVEAIDRVRTLVSEDNAESMSNDELLDACIELVAYPRPAAPPSTKLEQVMKDLRALTDGSQGAAFRNDRLHDTAHEATLLFEVEYGARQQEELCR